MIPPSVEALLREVVRELVRGSCACMPISSVEPMTCPGFTPPPAIQIVKPQGLWSRPSPFSLNGVRPNSPPQTTSVSLSIPRDLRSVSNPAIGRSDSAPCLVWFALTSS